MLSKKKKIARWDEGNICKGEGEKETHKHTSLRSSNLLQGEQRCSCRRMGLGAAAAPLGSSTPGKASALGGVGRGRQVVLLQGGSTTFLLWAEENQCCLISAVALSRLHCKGRKWHSPLLTRGSRSAPPRHLHSKGGTGCREQSKATATSALR